MEQGELLKLFQAPFSSGTAQVIALSSVEEGAQERWLQWMQHVGLPWMIAQPPLPWEPLAPLRHLFKEAGASFPIIEAQETGPSAIWLGGSVLLSRFFLRVTEALHPCQKVVWIEGEDLDSPVWGDFLRMACLGYLKLPMSFVFLSSQGQRMHAGMQRIRTEPPSWPRELGDVSRQMEHKVSLWGKALPKQTARFLGKALLFGDRLETDKIERVSRASYVRHRAELRRAGILGEDDQFALGRLRAAKAIYPEGTGKWRRQVWRLLEEEGELSSGPKRLWLRMVRQDEQDANTKTQKNATSSQESDVTAQARFLFAGGEALDEVAVVQSILSLGAVPWASWLAAAPSSVVTMRGRFGAFLLAHREADAMVPSVDSIDLEPPYDALASVRAVGARKDEGVALMNEILQKLSTQEQPWAAALVAIDLARWHLGQGRLRPAFQLLGPFKEIQDWGVQWAMGLVLTEVYCRLERYDLSRHVLEEAAASVPRPMSPVLVGELRMATARLFGTSGDLDAAEEQLSEARDAFRAAGDAVRLGRYLLAVGEIMWRREQFEEARGIFGKALDLFRRYRDAIGLWEAQLKLGLVLNQAPATILDARS
ncbi:MAG: tetratricopeptide repeat protein [Myxococcales bacterium]|nr:tetratricopeptide repeat protein [Myxococcales bacterium]